MALRERNPIKLKKVLINNQSVPQAYDFHFLIYNLTYEYDHGIDIRMNIKFQIICTTIHRSLRKKNRKDNLFQIHCIIQDLHGRVIFCIKFKFTYKTFKLIYALTY